MASSVCNTLGALADFQVKAIQAINGKFAALQRLANILEQAADLSGLIPNISGLVPISAIDLGMYEQLRLSCPFLNLPPAADNPTAAITKLQSQVEMAYDQLTALLTRNPLNKLGKLQQKMADFQSQFNVAALGGVDFMACLQAACQATVTVVDTASAAAKAAGTIASAASQLTPSAVAEISSTYAKNIVDGGGQVLSKVQQQKVAELSAAKEQVAALRDTSAFPTQPKL